MTEVHRDDIYAVRYDRSGRLYETIAMSRNERTGRYEEPRIGDDERAARAAYAVKGDVGTLHVAGPRDYRDTIARGHEAFDQLEKNSLHAAGRADVVRDNRDGRHVVGRLRIER